MSRLNVDQIYTRTGTGTPAIREMPAFGVELLNNQAINSNTDTLVQFDTTNFDFGSYWDGTNFRYLPLIAGYYQFNATLRFTSTSASQLRVTLSKNGTYIISSQVQLSSAIFTPTHVSVSHLMYCNGSSDYVDIIGRSGSASGNLGGTDDTTVGGCHFSGFLVRPD